LRKKWNLSSDQKIILLPSRISPIKGQKVLVEAMALLPPMFNDVSAIILGDDQGRTDYRRELEDLIEAKGLQSRIKLVAHCDDMPAAYSLSALVVAPSLVPEGFGRVPVEAMAMGVPTIASDLGGYRETIRHRETGWLVAANDAAQWAAAITEALSQSPGERQTLTTAAMQNVRALYDTRKMVADTLAVYDELMKTS